MTSDEQEHVARTPAFGVRGSSTGIGKGRGPQKRGSALPATMGEATTALAVRLVSIPNFQDWHDQSSFFEAMAYYRGGEAAVTVGSTAEYAEATRVSPEFFRVFAVEPVLGRHFTAEEAKPGGSGALVISYAYWQSHFGGDPHMLGQTVGGPGRPLPIVGVLPPGFGFPDKTDLWYPVNTVFPEPTAHFRGGRNYFAVGRLKPGVSLEQAQTEMTLIAQRLEQEYPESDKGLTVAFTRLRDEMVVRKQPEGRRAPLIGSHCLRPCFAAPAGQYWNAACFAPK